MPMRADWMWMNGQLIPWDQATCPCLYPRPSLRFQRLRRHPRLRHAQRPGHLPRPRTLSPPARFRQDHAHAVGLQRRRLDCGHQSVDPRQQTRFLLHSPAGLPRLREPWAWMVANVRSKSSSAPCPGARYLGPEAIEQGVDVVVSSWRRMSHGAFTPLAKIGGQYVNSQHVAMEAHDLGYTEGITPGRATAMSPKAPARTCS